MKIAALVSLLSGFIFFAAGMVLGLRTMMVNRGMQSATAVVTGTVAGETGEEAMPEVIFRTKEASEIQCVVVGTPAGAKFEKGAKVKVMYDPRNPFIVKIPDFQSTWLLPVILFFISATDLVVGYFMSIKARAQG